MPASYANFRFKFVSPNGKAEGFFPLYGRVDEETQLRLGEYTVQFADLKDVWRAGNRLALVLKPYIAVPKIVTEHLMPNTTTFIIEITDQPAEEVKSAIDQHRSAREVFLKKNVMVAEERADDFRALSCPYCSAVVDMSERHDSLYVYCNYCTHIFDRTGNPTPQGEEMEICPECEYFGRVTDYEEFHFYKNKNAIRNEKKEHLCCDTCASTFYEEMKWKNAMFLVGLPYNLKLKSKLDAGKNYNWEGIRQANAAAQNGNLEEAANIYTNILVKNKAHPGIHYNIGLMYFKAGMLEKAAKHFEKSLEYCANYEPTLKLLAYYKEVSWKVRVSTPKTGKNRLG